MTDDYPQDCSPRYQLRQGKWGPYFRDCQQGYDMPLQIVLDTLNRYQLRKLQLTWFVDKYGDPTAGEQNEE